MIPDLFKPPNASSKPLEPWRPRALEHDQWPPPYERVYAWRMQRLIEFRRDPRLLKQADAYYSTRPVEWINHWCDTYNPRKQHKWMPFVFFSKQVELVEFFEALRRDQESGLIEKARDMGATWVACAYCVWCLKYIGNDAIGWGSRKEALVDKLGDPDSIFEKMALIIKRLPPEMRPKVQRSNLKIINTENGSIIGGEGGDNIGRGGRKAMYFVDEAAHIERPELIEASLGDNTNVRIDISSVNGLGNVFHRRREAGQVWYPGAEIPKGVPRVFVMDWRDHPEKTQEWYDQRKAKAEREGMQHVFAQEVDRNYSAAVENTIISYEWIQAAIDAHLHIPALAAIAQTDQWMAGLDVADEGADKNALVIRQGLVLRHARDWGERDPGVTTRNMLADLRDRRLRGIEIQYDAIGVGSGVKSEFNRLVESGAIDSDEFILTPWHAGGAVLRPFERIIKGDDNSPLNKDFYHNFKAQAWWSVRARFYKTWRARVHGDLYDGAELISLSSEIPVLHQLCKELAQPTSKRSTSTLKLLVDKAPTGTRSPNLADATVMAYHPAPNSSAGALQIGGYSG